MSVYYKIYRHFFGCSQIKIENKKEELLNALSSKKIDFWGSMVDESGALLVYGSVFSARHIIEEGEKLGCEISVCKRTGLPFIFEKYKKRYGIIVGVILAWAFLFYTSLFIWEVRVAPRSGEDSDEIYALLKECGLEMGTFLPDLKVREVENQFLLNNPQYSFVAVNVYGTVANVELRRASTHGEAEDTEGLCNVVASKSGTVISVEAYDGSPVVKEGDTVAEGDLLISSFMQGRLGVWRGVHAYGKVVAAVYYDFETEIPINYEVIQYTGKEETKTSVELLNLRFRLFSDEKSSFNKCKAVGSREQVVILGIKLPLYVEKITYMEEEVVTVPMNKTLCKEKGETYLKLWMEREIKGEILSQAVDGEFDDKKGVYRLNASVTVAEDIGVKQYITK